MSDRYQSLSTHKILQQRARKRAEKTNLDYLVTAVSPILIMLLVGSLVFFLIDVFYRGEMEGGIRWVLFWFVMAIVLVARIGIEQSASHATIYGAGLAVATWLYLVRTHPAFLLGIVLLAIVWWSADRLVKDCTLIDEDADSSGSGLLQRSQQETKPPKAKKPEATKKNRRTDSDEGSSKHSPGRWILYYSLAALPLFGLGQLLISVSDPDRPESGFQLLIIYLLAATGLLLATSFLGLRRYLRQRSVMMPNGIAAQWIFSGVKIAALVFLLALAVPRPGVGQAWATFSGTIDHTIQSASKMALKFNPAGTGDGQEGNQGTPDETATNRSASGRQAESEQSSGSSQTAQNKTSGGQSNGSERPQTASNASGAQSPSSNFARTLVYLFLILAGLGLLIRYRKEWITILHALWQALLRLFQSQDLSPKDASNEDEARSKTPQRRLQPFHRFRNPFATGKAQAWSAEDLVIYTFDALQAWAEKEGTPAEEHLTPLEQTSEWSVRHPILGENARILGRHYSQLAYQNRLPADYHPSPLQTLWASLT